MVAPSMAEKEDAAVQISTKKVGKSVLDHFSQISSEIETKRIKNASLLLQYLLKSSNNKDYTEVQYALKRVIRGLGSSKNASRIGFYSTFVALLSTVPSVSADDVYECIKKNLSVESGNSKSEIGDVYIGQVLACGALIRSKKLFTATKERQGDVLNLLINAGKNRSYLSLAYLKFLHEFIVSCDETQMNGAWSVLSRDLLKSWPQQNLNSLYLLLLVQKHFPKLLNDSQLNECFGIDRLLCEDNLQPMLNIALNILTVTSLKHFLYPLLSEQIASSNLELPFMRIINDELSRYNRTKVMAASFLVRKILPHVYDSSKLPQFLPENLIQQILQHYRNNRGNKNDAEFNEEITQLFDGLCKRLQTIGVDTKTKIAILKKLIFYPGSFMFESITKSKNVQKLIRTLDKDGIKKLSSLYRDVLIVKKHKVVSPDVTQVWLNSERIYAAQLLTKLLTFSNTQGELEWKIKNLKMLMDVAIFKHKYANVGMELANNVKEVLFRALDLKCKLENMATVLYELMTYLKSIVDENLEHLRAPLTENELNLLNRTFSICTRLNGKQDKDECALVFEVLFLNMGLHLLQDKELAMSSVSELFMCYKRVFKKQESTNDDNFEWIDVVVDLFLNLLSHNSLLLRNMVGSVFPYLCKYLTPSSIHQILSVLDPNDDSNPLSHQSESDDDDDDDDDVDDEESENEKEDLESDEDDETVNDKLRMAVRTALGNNSYQTDEESIDLDDMSEGDAEKLDVALANAFRQFKPNRGKSKKQSKQDEILTHFRTRVLDLIEIYLNSEPDMLSCLEMMLPLLQLLEFTIRNEHQKPLLMRVKHCMQKLSNVKKFGSVEGVTEQSLGDLLSNLLERGTKNAMLLQDMANEISDCCVFVIKCTLMDVLSNNKKKCQAKIIEILTNAITIYFTKRDCLIPYNLFKSIFQISWEGNCAFAPLIFGFVFEKEIRPFRRTQALELLKMFYTNRRMDDTYKNFLCNIETSEKTFCIDVVNTLDNYCQCIKTEQIKEKFVNNLFNLLKVISNRAMKNTKIDWEKIGDKIQEFRSHIPLSRDTKVIYNQLCKQLQIPYTVEMKSEIIKFNNHNDSDDEITKKRQKTTESKREKKEAKARRVENMSEGFSNFSFTNLKNEETNGVQEDEENEIPNLESDHKTKLHKRRKSYTNVEESATKKLRYHLNKSCNV